jgi:hypothetical protein
MVLSRPRAYGQRVSGRRRCAWLHDTILSERDFAARGVRAAEDLERNDPLWPGQLATFSALVLYLALPPQLTIGPNWPLPVAEAGALATLIFAMRAGHQARLRRQIAIALVLIATLANLIALGYLAHYLVVGGKALATDLIGGGALIWATNLALFAVLYWELDRGGPLRPGAERAPVAPDFLFPQMTVEDHWFRRWRPGFADYLYVSLTNQTAFSPTDAMPLTPRVKILMGIQGVAALITTGVVVARAVNILG